MQSYAKRCCGCKNGSCLDGPTPCPHVDAQGFRIGAKRKLEPSKDGTIATDLETGELFHVRSNKKGKWLAPVFSDTKLTKERCMMVLSMIPEIDYHSQMDWTNFKCVSSSVVKVKCTRCGWDCESRVPNIYNGAGFGCYCSGKCKWNTMSGYQFVRSLLDTTAFETFDTAHITWEWWQENCTGNNTILVAKCKVCTEECSSDLCTLARFKRFSLCKCCGSNPKALRWKLRTGYDRMMGILALEYPNQDRSTLTWDLWQVDVFNAHSHITLVCKVCGWSTTSRINDIAHGYGFACDCTCGRWCSAEGHTKMVKHLESLLPNVKIPTWNLWQVDVVNRSSKIKLTCKACDWSSTHKISSIYHETPFVCRCSEHGRWAGELGHGRMVAFLAKGSKLELVSTLLEWQGADVDAHFKAKFRCKVCGACALAQLSQVHSGCGVSCKCKLVWIGAEGFDKMQRTLSSLRPHLKLQTTKDVWVEQVVTGNDIVSVQCLLCDQFGELPIYRIAHHGGFKCGCRNKTEMKLEEWLKKQFAGNTIDTQFRDGTCRDARSLSFDFVIHFPQRIFIELDGPQHFVDINFFNGQSNDKTIEHDLIKEEWVKSQGWCMVRVLQEDVWADRLGWDSFLKKSIAQIQADPTPRIIRPDAPEYLGGPYHDARRLT